MLCEVVSDSGEVSTTSSGSNERESDIRTWWLEGEVSDSPGMTVIGAVRALKLSKSGGSDSLDPEHNQRTG